MFRLGWKMHYDKKISFALGILLIGIVAALFFRHEKSEATEVPKLADAKALDERIAEQPIRPYDAPSRLSGVIEEPAQTETPSQAAYEDLPANTGDSQFSEVPDGGSAPPPDPIKIVDRGTTQPSGVPNPADNSNWTAIDRNRKPKTSNSRENQRSYKVKSGDTLSGIAYRFLGSSTRFKEIFEANRVLLRSPDDLRTGMTLRIPQRNRGTNAVLVNSRTPKSARTTDSKRKRSSASGRKKSPRKTMTSKRPKNSGKAASSGKRQESAAKGKAKSNSPSATRKPKLPTGRFIPIRRSPFRRRPTPLRSSSSNSPKNAVSGESQVSAGNTPTVDDSAWPDAIKQGRTASLKTKK